MIFFVVGPRKPEKLIGEGKVFFDLFVVVQQRLRVEPFEELKKIRERERKRKKERQIKKEDNG